MLGGWLQNCQQIYSERILYTIVHMHCTMYNVHCIEHALDNISQSTKFFRKTHLERTQQD